MISQVNSATARSVYQNAETQNRRDEKVEKTTVSQQGDTSRIEQLKASIASGEYQVDLEALARKIADQLM